MRYVVRTLLGMGLFAFCWVLFGRSLYELLDIGTCASGGPYVVAQECPEGTGWLAGALVGSIFGMFFALVPYLSRGTPPNAPPPANAWVIVWFWTGIFWSMAVGCFLAVWGPGADPGPGAEGAGIGVGIMGLLFGAGGFWAVTANQKRKGRRDRGPAPAHRGSYAVPVAVHAAGIVIGLIAGWLVAEAAAPDVTEVAAAMVAAAR